MRIPFTHPDLEELSRFLETTDARQRRRLRGHVARCATCQQSLAFLQQVAHLSQESPAGTPSAALLERIVSDRGAGARVILPTSDPPHVSRRQLTVRIAGVAAVVIGGAALLRGLPSASAWDVGGELSFRPTAPARGTTVRVAYRAGASLDGQRRLVLRAKYRTPGDRDYDWGIPVRTVALLERRGDGPFTGSFTLPDSAVYGAFAVEDTLAATVDDNRGRFWDLVAASSNGRLLLDGLQQRSSDMMGRDWEEGFATARRMVELYPDDPSAWSFLHAYHTWLGWMETDSIRDLHRAKLAEFDRRLVSQTVVPDEDIGYMAWYAYGLRDSALAQRWRKRLLREAPANSFAVQDRLMDVLGDLWKSRDTVSALAALEALWPDAGPERSPQVGGYARDLALRTGNPEMIRRWTNRMLETAAHESSRRAWARRYAAQFTTVPALRNQGMAWLRDELGWLARPRDEDRRLGEAADRQRRRLDEARRVVFAALGRALIVGGDRRAGLDTLALATAAGWDLDLFRTTAAARLEARDTSGALEMYALVSADPRTRAEFADSLRPLIARPGRVEWDQRLAQARTQFSRRIVATGKSRLVRSEVRVADATGQRHELKALTNGGIALVVFWSRFCGPAIEALPRVDSVATRLTEGGVRVISVVEERPSEELAAFIREKGLRMPVYHDKWHEASEAFNNWGTPSYYVLDANGRIRFDYAASVNDLPALVEALRLEASAGR